VKQSGSVSHRLVLPSDGRSYPVSMGSSFTVAFRAVVASFMFLSMMTFLALLFGG